MNSFGYLSLILISQFALAAPLTREAMPDGSYVISAPGACKDVKAVDLIEPGFAHIIDGQKVAFRKPSTTDGLRRGQAVCIYACEPKYFPIAVHGERDLSQTLICVGLSGAKF